MKKLQKKYSVAAFVDILGYKDLIQNEAIEREIELFEDLKTTIDLALSLTVYSTKKVFDLFDKKYESAERISTKLNVKQFSDNIYFSFDYEDQNDDDLLFGIYIISNISLVYQRLMLGKGYFVRGGIAMGLNMIDKHFIFSTALIDAVETEKNAVYPRIVLHHKLKEKFLQLSKNPLKEFVNEVFVQDWCGNVFLNPFNNATRNIKTLDKVPSDVLNQLENELDRNQMRMINRINKSFSYLVDDKQYNSIVRSHVSKRINKYKNKNQSIYEKYLWKRNFLNWVENKSTDLAFKFL